MGFEKHGKGKACHLKKATRKKILGTVVGRRDSVKDSRGEGTERRETSRRNLAAMRKMWAMWPDHLGATALAKVEGGFPHPLIRPAGRNFTFAFERIVSSAIQAHVETCVPVANT